MNWIFKNKKIPCEKSTSDFFCKLKNILRSKRTKTILVVLFLVCVFFINAEGVLAADDQGFLTNPVNWVGKKAGEVVGAGAQAIADATIGNLMLLIQKGMVVLVSIATSILEAVMNPDIISGDKGIFNRNAVKNIWVMVRDIANMFFILVLLFSAFCTIFQVEKWNLKKTWLNILINALLVNFSYPIARFFIDISNVAMYYFLNNMFTSSLASGSKATGSTIAASFGTFSQISKIMTPAGFEKMPLTFELMSIVFTFIFGMTLLILGALFLIRIVALTILIMFSPIGFVGFIFPSTQKFASDWWGKLFNYAFFGPIMVFMLVVALAITKAMGDDQNAFLKAATSSTVDSDVAKFVSNASFFMVPIVVLWFGMGVAKSMGIAGSNLVVDKAQGFAKSAIKFASGLTFAAGAYKAYQARRDQAKGDKWSNRLGNWAGNKQDQLRGGIFSKGYTAQHAANRYQSAESAKVAEEAKLRDTANMNNLDLQNLARTGSKHTQAAAYQELANRGKTKGTEELDKVRELFGENSQVFKQMQNKVKAYDPASAFSTTVTNPDGSKTTKLDENAAREHVESNQYDEKKLSANALGNVKFVEIAMKHGGLNEKGLRNLAEKSEEHKRNIKQSIIQLANDPDHGNTANETNMQIQLAHTAATGEIHSSLVDIERRDLIKRFDKDNTKNLTEGTIQKLAPEIAKHISAGKFNEIGSNLKTDESRKALVKAVNELDPPRPELVKQIRRSPVLAGFL
ncbi:MAG TPA: hypothetical protein P5323_00665 [Candidatus Moranbacteria bacterium]|nr:hypothetical protein [Candidatus Moranbacteria bacterium]HRY27626.1 hypothetical protein [Candidatus Moranbacteria bacterium]HSA07855.1 hypothetical protein [Candidatus Moranbacteria bacterium]